MASKQKKKKRSTKRAPLTLLAQIQRNLEKANYKQALKDAKVCYRQAPTDEHRRWLETASIARAQELQRQNQRDACRGVVEGLLELGIREPSVQAALPDVLIWLGMRDRLPADASEAERTRWDIRLADQAVLRTDGMANVPAAVREGVGRIRSALEAIYEEDMAAAQAQLRDIPRDSPLADWKLFARGLIAYYSQEAEQARANWSRLDPERSASRIAAALTAVSDGGPGSPTGQARSAFNRLEQQLNQQPVLTSLTTLQRRVAAGEWSKALQTLRGVYGGLRRLDASLCQRLVRWIVSRTLVEGRISEIDRLAQLVDPLPLDPNWNRARAMVREASDSTHPQDAIPYWHKYIDDLSSVGELPPAERALAQALVWLHVATAHMEEANEWRSCSCGARHDAEIEEEVDQSKACLERSIELAPSHLPAYQALAHLCSAQKEIEEAAAAYRRALDHVPDWFEALSYLAQHHLRCDEPIRAQEYAQRARRAKPLDRYVANLVWSTHVAAAREYARNGDYEKGRGEFAAADALVPENRGEYHVLGRKAALEIAAGCVDQAHQMLTAAQESLEEPAPLWLLMAIEATRMSLPAQDISLYEKRWSEALKRRCRGSTAGRMCALVNAHWQMQAAYQVPADYVAKLVAYVRRCTRVKWAEQDLHDVCAFLFELDEDMDLLGKYVRKGVKRFPRAAYFHFLAGELEVRRGPYRCRRHIARASLEKALQLSQGSTAAEAEMMGEQARRQLTTLDEASIGPRFPFGGLFRGEDLGHEEEDFLDEDFLSDEEDPSEPLSGSLLEMFEAACEEMGIDPMEFVNEAAARNGIPSPYDSQPDRSRKKKRRKKGGSR